MRIQITTHTTLLARLRDDGEAAAWHEFVDRYGELIRRFARSQGLQQADCDEVLQEVLVGLTKSLPGFTYDPAHGRFRGYLKTVVLRKIWTLRRQNRFGAHQDIIECVAAQMADDPNIEGAWEAEWRQHHLRLAMQAIERDPKFSEATIAAFRSYATEGKTAEETARMLGISVESVYQAKSRIQRKLADLIEAQVAEEG